MRLPSLPPQKYFWFKKYFFADATLTQTVKSCAGGAQSADIGARGNGSDRHAEVILREGRRWGRWRGLRRLPLR